MLSGLKVMVVDKDGVYFRWKDLNLNGNLKYEKGSRNFSLMNKFEKRIY